VRDSYASFKRTCREAFAFLADDWGFEPRVSGSAREASVTFVRPDAFVNIYTEWMEDPSVAVKLGRPATFGLDARIAKLDAAYAKQKPSGESAVLAYYARFLREHAREILGGALPRKPPPPEPEKKPRATRAGPLDFLARDLGWGAGSMREGATKETLAFYKDGVRLWLVFGDGHALLSLRISAGRKEVELDDAIAALAPEMRARRPKEQKARLAFYAEFLRSPRGVALLARKRSAWSRIRL
jgi:hypothetical protein